MKRFHEWLSLCEELLPESMDVMIKDYPYQDEIEMIGSIKYRFGEDLRKHMEKAFPGTEWVKSYDALEANEDDYLNRERGKFEVRYIDLPQDKVGKVIALIKYVLEDKGLKVLGKPLIQRYGDLDWRPDHPLVKAHPKEDVALLSFDIMIPKAKRAQAPKMNLSNASMDFLLKEVLGFTDQEVGEDLDIWKIKERIKTARSRAKQHVKAGSVEKTSGGATMIEPGYSYGRIKDYLDRLEELCDWALERGYKQIYAA